MEKLKDCEKNVKKILNHIKYVIDKPINIACIKNTPLCKDLSSNHEIDKQIKIVPVSNKKGDKIDFLLKNMSHEDEFEEKNDLKTVPCIIDVNEESQLKGEMVCTNKSTKNEYKMMIIVIFFMIAITYIIWNITCAFAQDVSF